MAGMLRLSGGGTGSSLKLISLYFVYMHTELFPDVRASLMVHFGQYISDHKKEFMERVLAQRTRHLTVVMENLFQSQNASAVVRTCECMGIQDIHIIENNSKYSVNPKVLK